MKRCRVASLLLLAGVWAAAASAEPLVPPRLAPLLDAAHDRILRRSFVPSEEQKVGELRLIRRGDSDVVQTLLYTKVLKRVVAEIRKKELASWPADQPGHEDAIRYVETIAGGPGADLGPHAAQRGPRATGARRWSSSSSSPRTAR